MMSVDTDNGASRREVEFGREATSVAIDTGAAHTRFVGSRSDVSRTSALSGARVSADSSNCLAAETTNQTEVVIRFLDIIGSLVILILALPIMLAITLLVKVTSGRPAFYRQERVGKAGKLFTLYKFRTMINDAEKHVGPVWASQDDDRVTQVGRVLRRMRFDELPQLYNVLRGDMSLVGPRPERPFFVERHKVFRGVRLTVKPGLTGLAQVRSLYDLPPVHKVKYDYLYIRNRSLRLNCHILLCTIPVVFRRKGW